MGGETGRSREKGNGNQNKLCKKRKPVFNKKGKNVKRKTVITSGFR